MKTIILLCAMAIFASGAFAQSPTQQIKSGVMKKGGKVWVVKPMDANLKMDNGLMVLKDGTVRTQKGKTATLSNGDCISKDGRLVALNDKAMDAGVMKQGKMWVLSLVDKPLVLENGNSIMPDGTMKTKDGKIIPLKNDEIVDIDGGN